MRGGWRRIVLYLTGIACSVVVFLSIVHFRAKRFNELSGAVLRLDPDPAQQTPLEGATITVIDSGVEGQAQTTASGLFRLRLDPAVSAGETLTLRVEHSNYQPLTMAAPAGDGIQIARMVPIAPENKSSGYAGIPIADVRLRYTERITTTANVGSIVRTFQVVNAGNVSCQSGSPCSPDGKWKATVSSASFDAGEGNQLRNLRVSCIAGPCPFMRIEKSSLANGNRIGTVWVRNWSDTVTCLVEAEVVRTVVTNTIRHFYPVLFGRSMSFTLPAISQGPSVEAELNGEEVVFPLGPALRLSWADCTVQAGNDQTKLYRCDLKPGYRFEQGGGPH